MKRRTAAAAIAAALTLSIAGGAGCGGSSTADETGIITATSPEDARQQIEDQVRSEITRDLPTTPAEPPGPNITTVPVDEPGRDGTLRFWVAWIAAYDDLKTGTGTVDPPPGARFLAAKVRVENVGYASVDPFCGTQGAELLDKRGRRFDLHKDTIDVEGNEVCREALQPGLSYEQTLVFVAPVDAVPAGVLFWDRDQAGDEQGQVDAVLVTAALARPGP